jgi:hypothetical protein
MGLQQLGQMRCHGGAGEPGGTKNKGQQP